MTYIQNIYLYVVCEGKSERNYLDALNRFFRGTELPITIHTLKPQKNDKKIEDGGGRYKDVVKRYNVLKKQNRNSKPWIWVDYDIYLRNDQSCMVLYKKKPEGIPDFLFTHHNFEDYLILHHDYETIKLWYNISSSHNHIIQPLHSAQYLPLYRQLFPKYEKGELPEEYTSITQEMLENALTHSLDESIPFRCDFIEQLAKFIINMFPDAGSPWNLIRDRS